MATKVAVPEMPKRMPPTQSILLSFSCAVLFFGFRVSRYGTATRPKPQIGNMR